MVTKMAFHERHPELDGVYAKAAVLGNTLPTECEKEPDIHCGRVNAILSKNLLSFFRIREDRQAPKDISISVKEVSNEDGEGTEATVFVSVEDKRAIFHVTSIRINNNGNVDAIRHLFLKTDLGQGMGLSRPIRPGSLEFEAFIQITALAHSKKLPIEPWLLCRTCPAQINGLPGTEV